MRDFKRLNILVVDDDLWGRQRAAAILEAEGHWVVQAESGEEAIERACFGVPELDLVFMDAEMPGMDGFEATRRLRDHHRTRQLPIVMVTGSSSSFGMRLALTSGADACMRKPYRRFELLQFLVGTLVKRDRLSGAETVTRS